MSMFAPSFDIDPKFPDIIRTESHVARRDHTGACCSMCKRRILKDQRYQLVVGVDTHGDFFIDKTHDQCLNERGWY